MATLYHCKCEHYNCGNTDVELRKKHGIEQLVGAEPEHEQPLILRKVGVADGGEEEQHQEDVGLLPGMVQGQVVQRLGDHAVNIADNANAMHSQQKTFSATALAELHVLEDLLREILDSVDLAFEKRDTDAAFKIEPLEEIADDMVSKLKRHHLDRMGKGECDIFVDANFENLMSDMMRIADVSTNIGEAVLVRVHPELADNEHTYFSMLRSGKDQRFNEAFNEAYARYSERFRNEAGQQTEEDRMPAYGE